MWIQEHNMIFKTMMPNCWPKKLHLKPESDTTSEDLDSSFHMSSQSESEIFENEDDADICWNSKAFYYYGLLVFVTATSSKLCHLFSKCYYWKVDIKRFSNEFNLKCVRGHINLGKLTATNTKLLSR